MIFILHPCVYIFKHRLRFLIFSSGLEHLQRLLENLEWRNISASPRPDWETHPARVCRKNQSIAIDSLLLLLIVSHGYSISTRFKLHLEGSFLLPWHSNLSHTFRVFFSLCSWSFLSILSFILIWSLFFRRLWGAGRSNCSVFLVPKPAIIKHYDIGASTTYLYEDFLVPFIQYED